MSDHILRIYPVDRDLSPPQVLDEELVAEVTRLYRPFEPHGTDAEVMRFARPHMIDGGAELSGATCPRCGSAFSLDWEGWGGDDWDAASWYADSTRDVPCCGLTVRLDELGYSAPTAFARFSLDITNPFLGEHPWGDSVDGDVLEARVVGHFAAMLGTRVDSLWMTI